MLSPSESALPCRPAACPERPGTYPALDHHLRRFFEGHEIEYLEWTEGPITTALPHFRIARIAPGPRMDLWVYVSVGAWEVDAGPEERLELFVAGPSESPRLAELVTRAALAHNTTALEIGSTVPLGEPWLEGSSCDRLLVSLPYPFGPELEVCEVAGEVIRVLWLVPITPAENALLASEGLEALEARFEEEDLEFGNPLRASVA